MSINIRLKRSLRPIFYGWYLVPVAGVVHMMTSVPMFHAMSLWFVALESTFGWSRTQLSFAFSFTRVEGGLLGPVEGYLTDRFGTKRMVLIGLLILGGGFLLLGQVSSLWMFYLAFLVMALGQGLGGWLPMNTMLNHWFIRRRTTAMGWSSSVSRLGGLILVPLIAWGVDPEADSVGWRAVATTLGIIIMLMAVPISKLVRNKPEDYGLLPDGDEPRELRPVVSQSNPDVPSADTSGRRSSDPQDFTIRQALRTHAFWYIAVGHGFTSMVIIGLMAHLAPMMKDQGFSVPTAGLVVTAYTAVSMLFQIIGGYVGDRIPKNVAIFFFTAIQSGAVLILTFATSNLTLVFVFAVLFGIGFGGRNPLTTSIRGDYFGRSSFGTIMGVSQVPMNVLLFIAPLFAGIMRDTQGDYTIAFATLAGLSFFGGILFLMAKKPVHPVAAREKTASQQTV